MDVHQTIQSVLVALALALAGVVVRVVVQQVPRALTAVETWLHIKLTEQQQATVLRSVQTAAGEIETLIDQQALAVAHVSTTSPTVMDKAREAIAAVPVAAGALGVTEANMARMIVGAVDTKRSADVVVNVTAPPAIRPA